LLGSASMYASALLHELLTSPRYVRA
jgi:hypothetical protein